MESLANYGSDDESGDYNDSSKNDLRNRRRMEEDTNYDEIGMDESSEESNNNRAESHFGRRSSGETGSSQDRSGYEFPNSSVNRDRNNRKQDEDYGQNSRQGPLSWNKGDGKREKEESRSYETKKSNEELQRRHSSDMEMDDGEDELDNYVNNEGSKTVETTDDFRQKFAPKSINFTAGKNLGEETSKTNSYDYSYGKNENNCGRRQRDYPVDPSKDDGSQKSREERLKDWEKQREQKAKEYDHRKDNEEEKRKKEEKDERKDRRSVDDKYRDSDRERKREGDRYRDERDKDRKRSPERREHARKRSHSPDRRDRDRDYDRDRDREREKDRDRDRDRDRRSPKHSRRNSRSPDRSWKARKLEKKTAVLNKLGIELKTEASGSMTPRQLLGEQLKTQIQEVEAKTGITLPTYYNPGVMNPLKYAQQIQKRKLLWGNKSNEAKGTDSSQTANAPSGVKQWEAATFKGDSDGKMTEKFKRLMGIKGDGSSGNITTSTAKPPETKEIIQKQEEMFSNMEAQYQVARMATHTHRGVGLGFGTFQVPPR